MRFATTLAVALAVMFVMYMTVQAQEPPASQPMMEEADKPVGDQVGGVIAEPPASQPMMEEVDKPVGDQVGGIIALFREKQWRPAIAALLTLLVFVWRRYAKSWLIGKIPAKHVPWVVALVGLIAALPAHLTTDPFVWWRFLLDGFLIGGQAALLWSTVGKYVLPKIFGEPEKV